MEDQTPERLLGRSIRDLRLAAGLSQERLAERMSEQGFSWRQTTVAKTESADRPIRVNEAVALASMLGVALENLVTSPDDSEGAEGLAKLLHITARVRALEHQITAAENDLDQLRVQLEAALAERRAFSRALFPTSKTDDEPL